MKRNRYISDIKRSRRNKILTLTAGILIALLAYSVSINETQAKQQIKAPECRECHTSPPLATYRAYRKFWRATKADQRRLLAELEAAR